MPEDFQQKEEGAMAYPHKGTLNRLLFSIPKIQWRMGLGPILGHQSRGGSKTLVLTTWGRKSQLPRHTMLSFVSVSEKVYVCSGWGIQSDWVKNIAANPQVTLQIGSKNLAARARRVVELEEFQQIVDEMFETGGDSHFESWLESYGIRPDPKDMLDKRTLLHIIGFDATADPGPSPMPVDLIWVWGAILIFLAGIWLLLSR